MDFIRLTNKKNGEPELFGTGHITRVTPRNDGGSTVHLISRETVAVLEPFEGIWEALVSEAAYKVVFEDLAPVEPTVGVTETIITTSPPESEAEKAAAPTETPAIEPGETPETEPNEGVENALKPDEMPETTPTRNKGKDGKDGKGK